MKFIIDNIWLFGILLLSGGALALPSLQRRGVKVTLLQATQMINQGKSVIVDVREPAEFAIGHILDSRNIPLKELAGRVDELNKFKSKSVIAVCESGVRSAKATLQLNKAGFNDVYSLSGGLAAWRAQGLPIVK